MSDKPPRAIPHSEAADHLFERLFAIANATGDVTVRDVHKLKRQFLSGVEEESSKRTAAKEFSLDETVQNFGLIYSHRLGDAEVHLWRIDTLPNFKAPEPSACLVSLLDNYTAIYDRSTKAACRVAVDFLLCECIAAMRRSIRSTKDGRRTPAPWDSIEVHCEVSFTHTINSVPRVPKTIVRGRVDHGIGITIRSEKVFNRLFYSLLLCVEAKSENKVDSAFVQLVVYLACLRQSRINRGRSDTSVYGVATDGLSYIFATITHEGILKKTGQLNVVEGHLPTVLGYFEHILETALTMSPNVIPEKDELEKGDELEADGDDPINLDDSPNDDDMVDSDDSF